MATTKLKQRLEVKSMNHKLCIKCNKKKLEDDFYIYPNKRNNVCKKCKNTDTAKYYHKNRQRLREPQNKYSREYYQNNKDYINERTKKYNKRVLSTEEGRERENARQRLRYHVKYKGIKKLPCLVCGEKKTEAHHYNGYKGENALKVVWLCYLHHNELHSKYGDKNLIKKVEGELWKICIR